MENLVELRDNWWWPKYDVACFKYLSKRKDLPKLISKLCQNLEVVIQAGGNAGMYPKTYSEIFKTVYTFEPDPINFYCLTKNTPENVIKFQSCLGEKSNFVNLSYNLENPKKPNSGGFGISGAGTIPTVTIDSFNFEHCDLIHLDIEGYEKFALLGALSTISRCNPVIALELNGLGNRYNSSDSDVTELLKSLGYKIHSIVDDDTIFMKG
jgi:FkbM family methyltransferase